MGIREMFGFKPKEAKTFKAPERPQFSVGPRDIASSFTNAGNENEQTRNDGLQSLEQILRDVAFGDIKESLAKQAFMRDLNKKMAEIMRDRSVVIAPEVIEDFRQRAEELRYRKAA